MNAIRQREPTGPGGSLDILILYDGAPAALVGLTRFSYVGELRRLPPANPLVRVVTHMGYYAQLVLAGRMPVAYTDEDAERFARSALIDPDELARRLAASDDLLASHFRVPPEQIERARQELGETDAR